MKVLMVGVDSSTKGGMWTVVENYINDSQFKNETHFIYVPTSITGNAIKKILFTLKGIIKIFGVLLTSHIDIVHIHVSERGSVYRKYIVLKLAKLFKCKTIFHMHGAEFQVWYENLDKEKQAKIRRIINQADSILILGEYWNEFVSTIADKDKIEIVHNAVSVPDKYLYNIEANKLLFLGVVGQRKGIDDLLQAMAMTDNQLDKDIQLFIYGPNPENDIEDKILKLGLSTRVKYKGWLDNSSKKEVFKDIALNILPSYNEGLPMTILETMAYGIPNVSTKVAAIPEAVNEENGVLIEAGDVNALADSILTLMSNKELRKEKSMKAYNDALEEFSLENHISHILKIYRRLEGNE